MKGLTLKPVVSAVALALALTACSASNTTTTTQEAPNVVAAQIIENNASNPFFKPYETYLGIPDFDKIKDVFNIVTQK